MTPAQVTAKKAALDAQLGLGNRPINVSFGYDLFTELWNRGHIQMGSFPNTAYALGVEGALPNWSLPSFGPTGTVCAVPSRSVAPDDFLVGAGGFDA